MPLIVGKTVARCCFDFSRFIVPFPPLPTARPRGSDGSANAWMGMRVLLFEYSAVPRSVVPLMPFYDSCLFPFLYFFHPSPRLTLF